MPPVARYSILGLKHNITTYIPNCPAVGKIGVLRPLFDKIIFDFNPSIMTYVCPLGERMRKVSWETRREVKTI